MCKRIIEMLKCLRCLHTWWPRNAGKPKRCPKCGTPYWNVPKGGIDGC